MFSMNILFSFGIEQIKAFLIVIEEKRLYKNFAGLVIHDRSAMLEFAAFTQKEIESYGVEALKEELESGKEFSS